MPSQRFLPEFELYVMLAIAHLDDRAYGAEILREIHDRTQRDVAVGALYATLARLTEKQLVVPDPREPEPGLRGRPRKYYRLSRAGELALQQSTRNLQRMMHGLAYEETA